MSVRQLAARLIAVHLAGRGGGARSHTCEPLFDHHAAPALVHPLEHRYFGVTEVVHGRDVVGLPVAVYLEPPRVSARQLAVRLDVAPSTACGCCRGRTDSPEMALRLSTALGRGAESWLAMQDAHDLCQARRSVSLDRVQRLELAMR